LDVKFASNYNAKKLKLMGIVPTTLVGFMLFITF
jgi:hypothetical protein